MPTLQRIRLESERRYGRRLPPEAGRFLTALQPALRGAAALRFRGRSSQRGRPPKWWESAGRAYVVGIEGDAHPELVFEVPTVLEIFPQLYEQGDMWNERPDPTATALDLLSDTVADISLGRADSDLFDPPLLSKVQGFKSLFEDNAFDRVVLPQRGARAAALDSQTVVHALELRRHTPNSRPARVAGTLDMLWVSRNMFAVKAPGGEILYGTLPEGGLTHELRALVGKPVVIHGRTHFRPSGSVLRVDADEIGPATERDLLFAHVPRPLLRAPAAERPSRRDRFRSVLLRPGKGGLGAVIGAWPGDETDDEMQEAMREVE